MITSVNRRTRETLTTFREQSAELDYALMAAAAAQRESRYVAVEERTDLLRNLASVLRKNRNDLAGLITLEMGKPITDSVAEIQKCDTIAITMLRPRGDILRVNSSRAPRLKAHQEVRLGRELGAYGNCGIYEHQDAFGSVS